MMASVPYLDAVLQGPVWLHIITILCLAVAANAVYGAWTYTRPYPGIPIVDLSDKGMNGPTSWMKAAHETVRKGVRIHGNHPFQIVTSTGPKIVVTGALVDEVKSHAATSFISFVANDFFAGWSGFDGFVASHDPRTLMLREVVSKHLTSLSQDMIDILVDETTAALDTELGNDVRWKSVRIKGAMSTVIARISSRILVGSRLCRDPEWIKVAKDYAFSSFVAAYVLRKMPVLFRPVAHWLLPTSYILRRALRNARRTIDSELQRRQSGTQDVHSGEHENTSIEWFEDAARVKRVHLDHTATQISMALASIATTSGAMSFLCLDLVKHPEVVEPMRQEIIKVIGAKGWTRASLSELRLMDSFMKESQRLHANAVSVLRVFEANTTLSDGTFIPTGARVMAADRSLDDTVFVDADQFNAYRFLEGRQQSSADEMDEKNSPNNIQYVSLSPYVLSFGSGKHACPGRFLAGAEIKIVLAQLLLKYDFKLESEPKDCELAFEMNRIVRDTVLFQVRRRKEEIDLDGVSISSIK